MSDKLKEKAVKMTNMRKYLVLGVAMAFAVVTGLAFAQDDLDDLLKDLEAETAKPAEKAAPAAEAPAALEQIIGCGCHKLLTSGCAPTALQGVEVLRQLVELSGGRIGIIAASGVTPQTIGEIMRKSGVREAHGACKHVGDGVTETDAALVSGFFKMEI